MTPLGKVICTCAFAVIGCQLLIVLIDPEKWADSLLVFGLATQVVLAQFQIKYLQQQLS